MNRDGRKTPQIARQTCTVIVCADAGQQLRAIYTVCILVRARAREAYLTLLTYSQREGPAFIGLPDFGRFCVPALKTGK